MEENRQHNNLLSLSERAKKYLNACGHPDNSDAPERVEAQFIAAGLPRFPIVIESFCHFGGYVLPMGLEGRFKVYRAKQAIRMMRLAGDDSDDPNRFRIPIGQSETIQAYFLMDGNGRIYKDDRPIADSMCQWVEQWARFSQHDGELVFGIGGIAQLSLTIYPVFEPPLKGETFDFIGEVLAINYETLDKIARSAKLTLFTAFADDRPIPDDFDGSPDELDEVMGEWTEWFDPAIGHAAMQALADHIKTSPKAAERLDDAVAVVEELEMIARVLETAARQGVRFRLELS